MGAHSAPPKPRSRLGSRHLASQALALGILATSGVVDQVFVHLTYPVDPYYVMSFSDQAKGGCSSINFTVIGARAER